MIPRIMFNNQLRTNKKMRLSVCFQWYFFVCFWWCYCLFVFCFSYTHRPYLPDWESTSVIVFTQYFSVVYHFAYYVFVMLLLYLFIDFFFFFCRDSSFLLFMFYEVMNSAQDIFEKSKNGKQQGTGTFQILAQLETPYLSFQKDMTWAQSKEQ